jgi:hypothetical protein
MIKAEVPAALVTTTAFRTLADNERRAKGIPDLPLLMIEHPLGGERVDGVTARAAQAIRALADAIAASARTGAPSRVQPATR